MRRRRSMSLSRRSRSSALSVLPRRKSGPGKASSLARISGASGLLLRQVARVDHDEPVGAEAARRRERHVLAQAAVAVELAVERTAGKRTGMAAEASACTGSRMTFAPTIVGSVDQLSASAIFLRDEDDGAARADVRRGDGDGGEDAGVEVLLDARERHGVGDELLDGRRDRRGRRRAARRARRAAGGRPGCARARTARRDRSRSTRSIVRCDQTSTSRRARARG